MLPLTFYFRYLKFVYSFIYVLCTFGSQNRVLGPGGKSFTVFWKTSQCFWIAAICPAPALTILISLPFVFFSEVDIIEKNIVKSWLCCVSFLSRSPIFLNMAFRILMKRRKNTHPKLLQRSWRLPLCPLQARQLLSRWLLMANLHLHLR